jgi:hypothetical protein
MAMNAAFLSNLSSLQQSSARNFKQDSSVEKKNKQHSPPIQKSEIHCVPLFLQNNYIGANIATEPFNFSLKCTEVFYAGKNLCRSKKNTKFWSLLLKNFKNKSMCIFAELLEWKLINIDVAAWHHTLLL